jgi:hypothetical protein
MLVNAIFASALSSGSTHFSFLFYTDPGAGALVWQLLLASMVGGAFYARLIIRRLKARFTGLKAGSAQQVSLNSGPHSRAIK